jgi:hypothetical protein
VIFLAAIDGVFEPHLEQDDDPNSHSPEQNEIILAEIGRRSSRGLLGVNRTLGNVIQQYYWLHARNGMESWCQLSFTCAVSPRSGCQCLIQQRNFGEKFERIAIGITGPFADNEMRSLSLLITPHNSSSGHRCTTSLTRRHRQFLMFW